MSLFKEIYCAECGAKTNLLTRTKLSDNKYLCSKCTTNIPSFIKTCMDGIYSLEDYHHLMDYLKESNEVLKQKFKETGTYQSLHLDAFNGLFYIEDSMWEEPVYLKLSNIVEFELLFSPDTLKEGIMRDKVYGRTLFRVGMSEPFFYYEKIIERKAKAKAKKVFFGTKLECENPKGMDDFLLSFRAAYDACMKHSYDYDHDNVESNEGPTPLQRALALFMYDNLEAVTMENLKAQRNKLIKTFHPDLGSEENNQFAQKINEAFEVLKTYLSSQNG